MKARLLSTIEPAPDGFSACKLSKRVLLSGPLILLTASVEEVLAAVGEGSERIAGVLLVPAPQLAHRRLGPLLWQVSAPREALAHLVPLLEVMLETIGSADAYRERAVLDERHAERAEQELQSTHDDYNRVSSKLLEDLQRTEKIAAENARLYGEAQDALRARDEFLSVASHELKTPLTPLKLVLQSIRRRLEKAGDAKLEALAATAERQVDRLTRLVENLLDTSLGRITLHPETVDLALLVRGVLDQFQAEIERSGCPLRVRAEPGVVGKWDSLRLEQVLANLISNAVKFGAGKPVEVAVERAGAAARLVVTDHGIGIAPEKQARLFQRYYRGVSPTMYGGLGLGLYVVRQIVEAHGGTVRLDSCVGEGTTFAIELPLGASEDAASSPRG